MTMPPTLLTVVMTAATTTKKTSGSAFGTVIYIAFLGVIGYFLWRSFGRNRRVQAARQQAGGLELHPGDEILTSSGIYGTVLDVSDDRVTIETAPGTRLTVVRSSIARRILPDDPFDDPTDEQLHDLPDDPFDDPDDPAGSVTDHGDPDHGNGTDHGDPDHGDPDDRHDPDHRHDGDEPGGGTRR